MKKLLTYICMLAFAASFTSCEKEIMDYEGVDGLYFDVRWGKDFRSPDQWAHQYYTPVEFGAMTANTYTAQVRVTTSGTIKDYDRPFSITIYNPQIQISAESGTKRSNFRQKDKTKRSKKGCTQHL